MDKWHITDKAVIATLKENGFTCEHPQAEYIPAAISFQFSPPTEKETDWYTTDCPIEWNERYTLPNGAVIRSRGTRIVLEVQA